MGSKHRTGCDVEGCGGKHKAGGLCGMHYQRTLRTPTRPRSRPVEERFAEKWVLDPETGCHVWTGAHGDMGHGVFWDGTRYIGAHVYAWRRENGPVPDGKVLDHFRCDNPPCVNPDHVQPATRGENTLRGDNPAAVNARKTHCKYGHEFTPENTRVTTGGRSCRECGRRASREYQGRRRAKVARALAAYEGE